MNAGIKCSCFHTYDKHFIHTVLQFSEAVRICSERASRVLAGDAWSIAGEARSSSIGKETGCGGGQNERQNSANTQTARRRLCSCVDLWMLRLGKPLPRNACAPQPGRAGNATTKQNFSHCQLYGGSFVFSPYSVCIRVGRTGREKKRPTTETFIEKGERKEKKKYLRHF